MVGSPLTRLRQFRFPFRAEGLENLQNFLALPQFILNGGDALLLPRGSFLAYNRESGGELAGKLF